MNMYKNHVVKGRKWKEEKSEGLAVTAPVTYCHGSAAEPRTVAFNSNIYFCPMSLGLLSGYANPGQTWLRVVGLARVICGWGGTSQVRAALWWLQPLGSSTTCPAAH